MESVVKLHNKLVPRFVFTYFIVILLPMVIFGNAIYTYNLNLARTEFINAKKELLISDKNHLETQFLYLEQNFNQFNASPGLSYILDQYSSMDREIVYSYISEITSLFNSTMNNNPAITRIAIYTLNHKAVQILPEFLPMQQLYQEDISEAFTDNPRRELLKKFWRIHTVNDELGLTYYAGLSNYMRPFLSGVLELSCDGRLLNPLVNNDSNIATYIFQEGSLCYSSGGSSAYDSFISDKYEQIDIENSISMTYYEKEKMLMGIAKLNNQDITIVRLEGLSSGSFDAKLLPDHITLFVILFLITNLILLPIVYRPIRNISKLASHMRNTKSHKLNLYPVQATNDEVGDLLREFNFLAERTNTLSDTVHQKEILLRNAQIEALQAQLNPHFFYGTLESIRMIAEAHSEELIAEITSAFGNLMRYSLSHEYFVPMENEIDIVRQYLDIQQKRLGDRFKASWNVDGTCADWYCPKFILFALVENIFMHAISKTRQRVNIQIDIIRENEDVLIRVTNDGPGIAPERLSEIMSLIDFQQERPAMISTNNGRSVLNISDRLRLYYGDNYRFTIESNENGHTICTAHIGKTPNV